MNPYVSPGLYDPGVMPTYDTSFDPWASHSSFGVKPQRPRPTVASCRGSSDDWSIDLKVDDLEARDVFTPKKGENSPKQSQIAATLKWLNENYERVDGVCLPRCVLYTHYLDFCKKRTFSPAGAATFGKIIRQKFPKLTTRRLGTRGQSKYHYYGVGIKETSIYYHSVYAGRGLTRFSGVKVKTEGSSRKYSLSSKTGTLLPDFPEINNLIIPESVDKGKVETFLMMYRTHCQRILDTIISANFDEIQNFLLHFWHGMPDHLVDILTADIVTDIAGFCDSVLYKVLIDVLIPSTIQDLPDSLGIEIKMFVKRLPTWLRCALENTPETLRNKKLEVANHFTQSVKRQVSFVHLAQTTRNVLLNNDTINQMVEDIDKIDLAKIGSQVSFVDPEFFQNNWKHIENYYDDFKELLRKQSSIEGFTEWMDTIVDRFVLQVCQEKSLSFETLASTFLLRWSIFGSLVVRDLTLHSAPSFGPFHLLHMMLDEYVFLVMETQQSLQRERDFKSSIQKFMKNTDKIQLQATSRSSKGSAAQQKNKSKSADMKNPFEEDDSLQNISEHRHVTIGTSELTAFSRPTTSSCNISGQTNNDNAVSELKLPKSTQSQCSLPTPLTVGPTLGPISPIKPYASINGGAFFSHFSSYPDFNNASNSLAASRVSQLPDMNQTFPTSPLTPNFNMSSATGGASLWPDPNRGHPGHFGDPYTAYSGYSYDKTVSMFRNMPYSTTEFARNPMEPPSRQFYSRPHDTLPGSSIPLAHYGGGYMDLSSQAAAAATFPNRPSDGLMHPDLTSSFTGSYMPYR
ncbi:unnamed protein product [Owenia fusiformis]|uniref:DNA-binding protein RFX6 n=1 Tax=Owenia fusiformis TaxID=6347 RepID=A0A8J1UGW5_OWEFU|nr:unnamed protein product [Owenia fusiformis]